MATWKRLSKDSNNEDPDEDTDFWFAAGRPRAIIGSSELWQYYGIWVQQDDVKPWVANAQVLIYVDENGKHWWLDLDSKNGAYLILPQTGRGVASAPVTGFRRVQLEDGTVVAMGATVLLIRLPRTKKPKTNATFVHL